MIKIKASCFLLLAAFFISCSPKPQELMKTIQKEPELDSHYIQGSLLLWNNLDKETIDTLELIRAVEHFEVAIQNQPDEFNSYHVKSMAHAFLGQYSDAITTMLIALPVVDDNTLVLIELGHLYDMNNSPEQSVESYQAAKAILEERLMHEKEPFGIKLSLAFINFFLEDRDRAIQAFQELEKEYPIMLEVDQHGNTMREWYMEFDKAEFFSRRYGRK